jgi:hypothetical protein
MKKIIQHIFWTRFSTSKGILVLCGFILLFFVLPSSTHAVSNFQFESKTKSVKMGESVEVVVKISTDKDLQVRGADMWMLFDQSAFEIQNINPGDFFSEIDNKIIGEKLYVAGYFDDATTVKSGDGIFTTMYLSPKKTGTFELKFDCRGNQYADTSKINVDPLNPQNIIDCASTKTSTLTISSTSANADSGTGEDEDPAIDGATDATTGGLTGGNSNATTDITTLPESGFFDSTLYYLLSGGFLILTGGILRRYYSI